ncbi:hypothetical protein BKA63DRAFT_485217 [Paraphoma chrysanthemicola]|nr:hypothetical protein BKA63DRAFT_485217 [Paraphoma chrysanthemicola]
MAYDSRSKFNAWASEDEASDGEERPTPILVELDDDAKKTITRLTHRTVVHIAVLYDIWREVQNSKHNNYRPPSQDTIVTAVGTLMTMPASQARNIFDIVDSKKEDTLCTAAEKALVDTLKNEGAQIQHEVWFLWSILDTRRNPNILAHVQINQDLGILMQTKDAQAKQILRMLKAKGVAGELLASNDVWDRKLRSKPDEGWEKIMPRDGSPPPSKKKRIRPRNAPPHDVLNGLGLDEDSDEEDGGRKKQKKTGAGFRPQQDDWRCGKCDHWSRKYHSQCQQSWCNGTIAEDSVEVCKWEVIE